MNEGIKAIISKHQKLLQLSCNKCHVHTADQGCFNGPESSIDVLIMAGCLLKLERQIDILTGKLNDPSS